MPAPESDEEGGHRAGGPEWDISGIERRGRDGPAAFLCGLHSGFQGFGEVFDTGDLADEGRSPTHAVETATAETSEPMPVLRFAEEVLDLLARCRRNGVPGASEARPDSGVFEVPARPQQCWGAVMPQQRENRAGAEEALVGATDRVFAFRIRRRLWLGRSSSRVAAATRDLLGKRFRSNDVGLWRRLCVRGSRFDNRRLRSTIHFKRVSAPRGVLFRGRTAARDFCPLLERSLVAFAPGSRPDPSLLGPLAGIHPS